MPDLDFEVESAEVLPYAAVPTILFRLGIQNAVEGEEVNSISLRTQIRIAATQRRYDPAEQAKLRELFGEPHQWKDTLRSVLWTNTNTIVPRFSGGAVFEMPVTCTYDFDVVGTKYFAALEDGEIPLEFLFSGTVFYRGESGTLQVAQISWEKEAKFRLPVRAVEGDDGPLLPEQRLAPRPQGHLRPALRIQVPQRAADLGENAGEPARRGRERGRALTDPVEKIAAAVLYEGYVLWPYRRSAQKNQKRWTFGGVYPRAFSETAGTNDPWLMQTQCLVTGQDPTVEVKVRFLHVVERKVAALREAGSRAVGSGLNPPYADGNG